MEDKMDLGQSPYKRQLTEESNGQCYQYDDAWCEKIERQLSDLTADFVEVKAEK